MVWPLLTAKHNYIELWQKKLVHMLFNILMLAITKLKMSNIHLMAQRLRLISPKGSIEINLPYLGEHNVKCLGSDRENGLLLCLCEEVTVWRNWLKQS